MTVDLWYTSVISYLASRPARDLIVAAHQELTLAEAQANLTHALAIGGRPT